MVLFYSARSLFKFFGSFFFSNGLVFVSFACLFFVLKCFFLLCYDLFYKGSLFFPLVFCTVFCFVLFLFLCFFFFQEVCVSFLKVFFWNGTFFLQVFLFCNGFCYFSASVFVCNFFAKCFFRKGFSQQLQCLRIFIGVS